MIAETASTEVGGDKAAWITNSFASDLPGRLPRVRAVIWWDHVGETDWRVNSSAAALAAYRSVAASPFDQENSTALLAEQWCLVRDRPRLPADPRTLQPVLPEPSSPVSPTADQGSNPAEPACRPASAGLSGVPPGQARRLRSTHRL